MRAYDIDGVLTAGIKPEKPYVVISGRTIDEWEKTVAEIGTDAPIYLRPYGAYGDHILAGMWKAEMIKRLGVTEFTEDVPLQAAIIQAYNPDCKINLMEEAEDK